METLRLKHRESLSPSADIENWDDDDFLLDDDISFQGRQSTGPIMPQSPSVSSHRRDSHSSHVSFRSERESLNGEERHILLPEDEKSTMEAAITAAHNLGIPLPDNVPASALMGGSIKRLGGRKVKKVEQDDWVADLAFPEVGQKLCLKQQDPSSFPETLRHVSDSAETMAPEKNNGMFGQNSLQTPKLSYSEVEVSPRHINLDAFRDNEDDDDFFAGEMIRISKRTQRQPISLITPPTPQKSININSHISIASADDNFEVDLELPSDGKLTLSKNRDIPRTSLSQNDDLDWGDGSGSLGTRYGGTRREMRSTRSSSASALSPSVGSTMTIESEDDNFDGLELPSGILDLESRLRTLSSRRKSHSPDPTASIETKLIAPIHSPLKTSSPDQEDFLSGLEIGEGSLLDTRKKTVHKHVKRKNESDKISPLIKTSASITFTNKPILHQTPQSRLPRLSLGHSTQTLLEPVSESGGPIQQRTNRRPPSRVGHSNKSSTSSVSTTATQSSTSSVSSTSSRHREVGIKTSTSNLREPTTTNAQLLRMKRSLPVLRGSQTDKSLASASTFNRPPSRTESSRLSFSSRPSSILRPRTPTSSDSSTPTSATFGIRKTAAASASQNLAKPAPRAIRRHTSEISLDTRPMSRTTASRNSIRSPSPRRYRANEKATLDGTWRQFSKPKTRHFGDGHELDAFDDLPTSATAEAKFTKAPVTTGPKTALHGKLYANIQPESNSTLSLAPFTPTSTTSTASTSYTPRFARDTASSRIARETSIAQRAPSHGTPASQIPTPRVTQLASRSTFSPGAPWPVRSRKPRKMMQQKPHLISNMGGTKESKSEYYSYEKNSLSPPSARQKCMYRIGRMLTCVLAVNGMCYNPDTYRWEGNDGALAVFEPPSASLSPAALTMPALAARDREHAASTPRPALITNISATKGIQVVGGMVFDPQNMCWLKISHHQQRGPRSRPSSSNLYSATTSQTDIMESIGSDVFDDSDEDPFKDIPDLADNTADSNDLATSGGRTSDAKDDWLIGEEFDVGPEFIRRQREEEERWRKKCEKWIDAGKRRDHDSWRWTLRDLVVGDYQI